MLAAFVALIRMGSGMDWHRTLRGAWLVLRAIQLWTPYPDNDPDGARACMRRFYVLVRLSYGAAASPAEAAKLEVDWWRVHLCVPKTSSTSSDQAIFADRAVGVSLSSDAVPVKIDRFGQWFQRRGAAQGAVRPC